MPRITRTASPTPSTSTGKTKKQKQKADYEKTDGAKNTRKNYRDSEAGKVAKDKYKNSAKGKAKQEEMKIKKREYAKTDEGKAKKVREQDITKVTYYLAGTKKKYYECSAEQRSAFRKKATGIVDDLPGPLSELTDLASIAGSSKNPPLSPAQYTTGSQADSFGTDSFGSMAGSGELGQTGGVPNFTSAPRFAGSYLDDDTDVGQSQSFQTYSTSQTSSASLFQQSGFLEPAEHQDVYSMQNELAELSNMERQQFVLRLPVESQLQLFSANQLNINTSLMNHYEGNYPLPDGQAAEYIQQLDDDALINLSTSLSGEAYLQAWCEMTTEQQAKMDQYFMTTM